jgi:hypothetical protein
MFKNNEGLVQEQGIYCPTQCIKLTTLKIEFNKS